MKEARGTFRKDRAPANEAKPRGLPKLPSFLNEDAKREFRRLVKQLGEMKLIGSIDERALARYASTWCRWRQAVQIIDKAGEMQTFKDENGRVKSIQVQPYVSLARSLADELGRLEQAFGMNPSARSRINVAGPGDGELELPE